MFDTHSAAKELTEAGFEEAQAEAVVATVSRAMGDNLATKADIALVQSQVDGLETRLLLKMAGIGIALTGLGIAIAKLI